MYQQPSFSKFTIFRIRGQFQPPGPPCGVDTYVDEQRLHPSDPAPGSEKLGTCHIPAP
jgi:hypothetical protein